jgi:hypothetical protein
MGEWRLFEEGTVPEWMSTPCDEWPNARTRKGYGKLRRAGRYLLAHRDAWERKFGPIPDGLFVLHRCDNPPCRNTDHLFLGTNADNVADMISKGRKKWKSSPGEGNGRAVLSSEQVREIQTRYVRGATRQVDLAAEYGISQSQISNIVLGRSWMCAR